MNYILWSLLLLLSISACSSIEGRRPNQFELAYIDLAFNLEDPSFCYKIQPKAYLTAGWGGKGHQIHYVQSDCLYDLALKTKNPVYCKNIKTISTLSLDGSKVSKENCEKEVLETKHSFSGGYANFNHTLIMTAMDYTEEMWSLDARSLYDELVGKGVDISDAQELAWGRFYLHEVYKNKGNLKERASKLPDFKE